MQTPNMQGLLEQPNEVAALPLIIQHNVIITQQLIQIESNNLASSKRRRCGSLVAIVRHLLLLWSDDESFERLLSRLE